MPLHRRTVLIACLLFLLLATIVYIPASPPLHPIQDRDAGVFLYVAKQMQLGYVPYRDVWDHKPLGIYLLPLLGFSVSGGSLWGPWVFAVFVLTISACLGFLLLRIQIGTGLSFAVICSWLLGMSLFVQRDPFLTETTALPFQIAAFLLVFWLVPHPSWERARWGWLMLGATIAFSGLLKPFLAGLPAVAALLLLVRTAKREQVNSILWMCYGVVGPLAGALIYLISNHALKPFYDQVILYNLAYGDVSWHDRLLGIAYALQENSAVSLTASIAWVSMGVLLQTNRASANERSFLLLLWIGWPLDLILSSLPGRTYLHYYIGSFWLSFVMIGWLLYKLQNYIARWQVVILFRWIFLASMFIASLETWLQIFAMETLGEQEQRAAISYVESNVPQNHSVLFWGAETSLYLATNRTAPTRVVYQYPLYTLGYETAEISKELLTSLETKKPEVIIDTSATNPAIPPLNPQDLRQWQSPVSGYGMTPGGDVISSYVADNYEIVDVINGSWPVYQLKK